MNSHGQSLGEIIDQHQGKVTDKWKLYISEYERIFEPYRSAPVNLLEIGVQNGGSLEIWRKYFANAKRIVGCDIDPKCAELIFDDDVIRFVVGDANANEIAHRLLNEAEWFDIVIDDGSHISGDIIRSFAKYFPRVRNGGLFVIEDLHCSYWLDFEGGLFNPDSAMAFLRLLSDIVNHEHWGTTQSRRDLIRRFEHTYHTKFDDVALAHIHSVEFVNSLCIVRKAEPAENILSSRVSRGTEATVYAEALTLNGMRNFAPPDQSASPWSVAVDHNALIARQASEIELLQAQIADQERRYMAEIDRYKQSLMEHEHVSAERDKLCSDRERDHSYRLADQARNFESQFKTHDELRAQRERSLLEQLSSAHQRIKQLIEKQIDREREYTVAMLHQQMEPDSDLKREN